LKILICRKQKKRSQLGFTLVEMMIGLVIGTMILAGIGALMQHLLITTAQQSDKTLAQVEVHYVSFWIGEDVAQAQSISLAKSSTGFPLTLNWTDPEAGDTTIIYSVGNMTDKLGRTLLKLTRTKDGAGNSTVAEHLVPEGTRCYQKTETGNESVLTNVLVLEVTARVDQKVESGSYEISPRAYSAGNVTW
jgi:prepilin-type N-terminal cleavage/methylation domain-containing protein